MYDFLEKEMFAESGLGRREGQFPGPYGVVYTALWKWNHSRGLRVGPTGHRHEADISMEAMSPLKFVLFIFGAVDLY